MAGSGGSVDIGGGPGELVEADEMNDLGESRYSVHL